MVLWSFMLNCFFTLSPYCYACFKVRATVQNGAAGQTTVQMKGCIHDSTPNKRIDAQIKVEN